MALAVQNVVMAAIVVMVLEVRLKGRGGGGVCQVESLSEIIHMQKLYVNLCIHTTLLTTTSSKDVPSYDNSHVYNNCWLHTVTHRTMRMLLRTGSGGRAARHARTIYGMYNAHEYINIQTYHPG